MNYKLFLQITEPLTIWIFFFEFLISGCSEINEGLCSIIEPSGFFFTIFKGPVFFVKALGLLFLMLFESFDYTHFELFYTVLKQGCANGIFERLIFTSSKSAEPQDEKNG